MALQKEREIFFRDHKFHLGYLNYFVPKQATNLVNSPRKEYPIICFGSCLS